MAHAALISCLANVQTNHSQKFASDAEFLRLAMAKKWMWAIQEQMTEINENCGLLWWILTQNILETKFLKKIIIIRDNFNH